MPRLVRDSVGARLYPKAKACLGAMRAAAVARGRPAEYNALLAKVSVLFGIAV